MDIDLPTPRGEPSQLRPQSPTPPPPTPPPPPPPPPGARLFHQQDPPQPTELRFDIPPGTTSDTMDESVQIALKYINLLKSAKLEDSGLSEEDIYCLKNPRCRVLPDLKEDLGTKISLKLYKNLDGLPQRAYKNARDAIMESIPDIKLLTYEEAGALARRVTGVTPIFSDMCPEKSCIAFTGPYRDLNECPQCGASRWKDRDARKKEPQKQSLTLPVGPAIQALFAGKDSAIAMDYRRQKTRECLEKFAATNGVKLDSDIFDDLVSGDSYLDGVLNGRIRESDTLLMFSIDGAQLYRYKESDCWIYIWIVMELSPEGRYKKKHVIPGGIFPGPHKPGVLESFLFPGLYHVAALQNEPGNLRIYDACRDIECSTCPIVILATADAPGMAQISGFAGHTAKFGCRKACGFPGRHIIGKAAYYPLSTLPDDYHVRGCDHPDIDLNTWSSETSQDRYNELLMKVIKSRPGRQYDDSRKESGFSKPSMFSGLPRTPFNVPSLFPLDCMHLLALNIPELLIPLWRGNAGTSSNQIRIYPPDKKETWDWAILVNDTWVQHGKKVDSFRTYLPSTYERPPRNPQLKISSGYKACEYLTYFYGFLPILLRDLLPDVYLKNFYKLVRAVRLFSQASISRAEINEGRKMINDFLQEFEEIYIQRKSYRLHFLRQCLHALWHIPGEVERFGPLRSFGQWSIERMIGIYGGNVRLHSNSYANISQVAIKQFTLNALSATFPELAGPGDSKQLPSWSIDVGDNCFLLHPHDQYKNRMHNDEVIAFSAYFGCFAEEVFVERSARLLLPNLQKASSALRENAKFNRKTTNRMVKIIHPENNTTFFGEVHYYFRTSEDAIHVKYPPAADPAILPVGAFAMVSLFSAPEKGILRDSFNVVCICHHEEGTNLAVFPVRSITAVIAALPYAPTAEWNNWWYILEELGLDIAVWGERITQNDEEQS